MAKTVGIGAVSFRAKDPAGLMKWYSETLGVPIEEQGDYGLFVEPAGKQTVFAAFPLDTEYFGESGQSFMINFRVDDLDGCLAAVVAAGGTVDPNKMEESFGRFGWFTDPEGNRVELWEESKPSA
jgi:predicted enzyme related to lactoylglutathione lyase